MKCIFKAVLLVSVLSVLSCGDKATDESWPGVSTFPLTTDSRWEYTLNHYDIPFEDSSLADTQTFSILRHVIGPDTLIDSNQTIAVDDSTSRIDTTDATPFVNRHLYGISGGNLLEYGEAFFLVDDTPEMDYYDPPHILLNLPLEMNKAWTESTEDFVSVFNTVVGIQYVPVSGTEVKCSVVQSRMIDINNGHVYFDSYLWYSNQGLMRSELDLGIRVVNDESGDPIDSIRTTEVLELIDMEIQGG
jgi:hypothetical protein